MSGPSVPTIKRLYAVSGNQCAFPKCSTPLVDVASGKVTGRVCHIKGNRRKGPRYDETQTDEERHGFANLLLLCPIHHDVVDADEDSYTCERLTKMKTDHESRQPAGNEPSDAIAVQLISNSSIASNIGNLSNNTLTDGSIIVAPNQLGGQIGHKIYNLGPPQRQISQAAANALVSALRCLPPETIHISYITDTESSRIAIEIKRVLELSGWRVTGCALFLPTTPQVAIHLMAPKSTAGFLQLLSWCHGIDPKTQGTEKHDMSEAWLIVGANAT
jgi:hypothetical protein